jgi:hypothetical protein
MNKDKILNIIGQIEKSINEVEPILTQDEFEDYCDNAYTLISYWRKVIKLYSDATK